MTAVRIVWLRPLGVTGSGTIHRSRCCSRSLSSSPTESATTAPSTQFEQFKHHAWERWEESSGQRELDGLKLAVQRCSIKFDAAVESVRNCRSDLEVSQRVHDDAAKRHANLMMRRDQWDPADAAAFVEVTATEGKTRRGLADARNSLWKAEEDASQCQRDYMDIMRQRYHEEQIWQDKWRMMSTYGTWLLIGLNSIVFLGSQLFHQRREVNRLKSIEGLIRDNLRTMQDTVETQVELVEAVASSVLEEVASGAATPKKARKSQAVETASRKEDVVAELPKQSIDWIVVIKEHDYVKVKQFFKDLNIGGKMQDIAKDVHGPSMALGAATSATAVLVLMFATSRR